MAETMIVVFIDRAGENQMPKRHLRSYFTVVGIEPHFNQRMLQHFLEHRGIAVFWQGLELLREITIVAVRPDRDPPTHRRIEVPRVALPLFARVIFEKHFVQLPRSEEHTSELQSHSDLVCRLLLEKKKK